jgi:hypothetical protein
VTVFFVDTERTELDVEVHPSLFGFRVRITGLHGEIQGDLLPDGSVDLQSTVGARVTMNVNDLDLGSPLLTRTTHGALGLATDGSVSAALVDVDLDVDDVDEVDEGDDEHIEDGEIGHTGPRAADRSIGRGQAFRFTFDVESGALRGRLVARATVEPNDDGTVTVAGATEFRAADFDVHLPGLGHLRGVCHWTVVVVTRG